MKDNNTLPMYGVGPIYVAVIMITTIVFSVLPHFDYIPSYNIDILKIPLLVLGIIFIVLSIYMWYVSVIKDKVDKYISEGKLVTTGIYSYTRIQYIPHLHFYL